MSLYEANLLFSRGELGAASAAVRRIRDRAWRSFDPRRWLVLADLIDKAIDEIMHEWPAEARAAWKKAPPSGTSEEAAVAIHLARRQMAELSTRSAIWSVEGVLRHARRAVELSPASPEAHRTLGMAFSGLRRWVKCSGNPFVRWPGQPELRAELADAMAEYAKAIELAGGAGAGGSREAPVRSAEAARWIRELYSIATEESDGGATLSQVIDLYGVQALPAAPTSLGLSMAELLLTANDPARAAQVLDRQSGRASGEEASNLESRRKTLIERLAAASGGRPSREKAR